MPIEIDNFKKGININSKLFKSVITKYLTNRLIDWITNNKQQHAFSCSSVFQYLLDRKPAFLGANA